MELMENNKMIKEVFDATDGYTMSMACYAIIHAK
jgi:hypothetical protein